MVDYTGSDKKTAGEILKETRESKGLPLTTVHEVTKIPMDVLKAIEEGYSVRTLSPFYLKGFIKMYAEHLGVDVSKVLESPIPVLQKAAKVTKPELKKVEEKSYALPEGEFDLGSMVSKERQKQIVVGIGILLVVFLIVRLTGCLISGTSKTQPKAKSQTVKAPSVKSQPAKPQPAKPAAASKAVEQKTKSAAPAEKPAVVTPAAQPQGVVDETPAVVNKEPEKVRLTIKAQKGGWLQVKVDGATVMESTVKAGTVETWEANQEIIISGSTIHNLEFELNGKMLGTLGRQDRNARRVVVTKRGLAVKN